MYPDYGEYQYTVCRRMVNDGGGDALTDSLRNGATVCKEDAALTDTIWNRTYTVYEFNANFKVSGLRHGEETYTLLTQRHNGSWYDAEGWRYSANGDGTFKKGITGDVYEVESVLADDLVLVR